jgi:hypothetical protein
MTLLSASIALFAAGDDLLPMMGCIIGGAIVGGVALKLSMSRDSAILGVLTLAVCVGAAVMLSTSGYAVAETLIITLYAGVILINLMVIMNYFNKRGKWAAVEPEEEEAPQPKKKKKKTSA